MDSRIWKVIIAVAALHVLVLGSIFVINHGCKRTTPETAKAEPLPLAAPAIPPSPTTPPAPGSVQPLPSVITTSEQTTGIVPPPPVPPVAATRSYTVKQGDTLAKIAKAEGVGLNDLTAANPGLTPTKLRIGQELHVPAAGTESAAAGAEMGVKPAGVKTSVAGGGTYTVKKGDTLAKIAKTEGTTVTALKKVNHLASDTIRVGQKLQVPTPGESGARPSHEKTITATKEPAGGAAVESSGATHIVQAGETPAVIAKQYGVSTKALLAANGNLDPKKLKIGQKLVIPGKAGETNAAPPIPPVETTAPVTPAPAPDATATGGVSGSAVAPPMTPSETPAPAAPTPVPAR